MKKKKKLALVLCLARLNGMVKNWNRKCEINFQEVYFNMKQCTGLQ
jgi:hypothetical protein